MALRETLHLLIHLLGLVARHRQGRDTDRQLGSKPVAGGLALMRVAAGAH